MKKIISISLCLIFFATPIFAVPPDSQTVINNNISVERESTIIGKILKILGKGVKLIFNLIEKRKKDIYEQNFNYIKDSTNFYHEFGEFAKLATESEIDFMIKSISNTMKSGQTLENIRDILMKDIVKRLIAGERKEDITDNMCRIIIDVLRPYQLR